MATYVEFHWETSYDRTTQAPFHCIEFSSMKTKGKYFSAIYKGFYENFIILEHLCGSSSTKEIIELLCGCFEPESNFDKKIKDLLGNETVQAICINLNEIPVMISYLYHDPDVICHNRKIAFENSLNFDS